MKPLIIDVREPAEYASGHVEGAINLPPSELMKIGTTQSPLNNVGKDTEIIVYCLTGSRSNVAKSILEQAGFTNISNGINQGHVEAELAKNS